VPLLRYYRVWNVEQTEGIGVPEAEVLDFEPIEAAERILREMPERPPIVHQDPGKAWYDPWGDKVNLPKPGRPSRGPRSSTAAPTTSWFTRPARRPGLTGLGWWTW
jgi:antirestriction protein ArdC